MASAALSLSQAGNSAIFAVSQTSKNWDGYQGYSLLTNFSCSSGGTTTCVFTGTISGTTLTITLVTSGVIAVGNLVTGPGLPSVATVLALGTGTGGVGTYTLSVGATVATPSLYTAALPLVAAIATANVQVSNDPSVESPSSAIASGAHWNLHDVLQNMTGDRNSSLAYPVLYVRLQVTAWTSGTVTLNICYPANT